MELVWIVVVIWELCLSIHSCSLNVVHIIVHSWDLDESLIIVIGFFIFVLIIHSCKIGMAIGEIGIVIGSRRI